MTWRLVLPKAVLADEGVCENEELSGDGHEGDLVRPPCGSEPLIKSLHWRIAAFGAERAEIQNTARRGASGSNQTLAFSRSGLVGERS
jgi:hypothetical protein